MSDLQQPLDLSDPGAEEFLAGPAVVGAGMPL